MKRFFESNAKVDNVPQPDAKIIIYEAPYICYPQIKLQENLEVYSNSSLRAKKALRTGIRMTPYQQSFEINTGTQSIYVNFVSANRHFALIEVSLVYDKSDQDKTIYDSYNVEITVKIQSLKIENVSTTYTLTSEIKYDVGDADSGNWLYAQFVAFSCNGCSIAPLIGHGNNEVYQELVTREKYLNSSHGRLYIDQRRIKSYTNELEKLTRDDSGLTLTVTLKDTATKKMELKVMGY